MNQYLKNLEKIEFVITNACTGRCKHCSQGEHGDKAEFVEPESAASVVRSVTGLYPIKTVMTFGGEPLLYPKTVFAVHKAAMDSGVPRRQLITNGFFTRDITVMRETAKRLYESGVNDLLLSVDSFHAESIPMDSVKHFALEVMKAGVPIRTQPAWLVSRDDENPYNIATRELLSEFAELGIEENEGNIIFPEGNALVYLKEYFSDDIPENPYTEDPKDIRCLSIDSKGELFGRSIYSEDIKEIVKNYKPY